MHPPLRRRDFLEGLALLLSASRLHAQSHSPSASADLARSIAGAGNNLLAVLRPELRHQLEFAFARGCTPIAAGHPLEPGL